MKRVYFQSNNLCLSYIDYNIGESEKVLLALHGHFGNARMFSSLASNFDDWKVIALDQRGHGWSEHPENRDYSREAYIEDIKNFITTVLNKKSVVIIGHSLGGANAYQFASKYPELVKAMIIEDIGAEIEGDASYAEQFPNRVASLKELKDVIESRWKGSFRYFGESAFEDEHGWGFRFDSKGMIISQQNLNGSWWNEWTNTDCPTLLLHGKNSDVVNLSQIKKMKQVRKNTTIKVFEGCGHTIHDDNPLSFNNTVKNFLELL
ncbi:alpha/beta fold hydrolase [Bacillus sp. CGMCC 1.16607]|uniref:alpha/beta fold hydrolase n=1 Tax=Bacillus sp. CGMCC 1.16607 TaxID=3351842 RepID=UPI0036393225